MLSSRDSMSFKVIHLVKNALSHKEASWTVCPQDHPHTHGYDRVLYLSDSCDFGLGEKMKAPVVTICMQNAGGQIMTFISKEDRYAFLAEWYDTTASVVRRYQLFFYPKDGSVEMDKAGKIINKDNYRTIALASTSSKALERAILNRMEKFVMTSDNQFDVKNQRIFLRRTKYENIHQEDLFVGNRVNVFSRQLNLIKYGDQYTANKLSSKKERTFALIKPDAVTKIGDILELIYSSNLIVTKAKMTKLTWSQAADFYMEHQSKPFFNNLVQFVSSGPVVGMELMGAEAMSIWRKLLGPADGAVERKDMPRSIHAQFGTDGIKNVAHGSDSLAAAARELEFFFPSTPFHCLSNTATFTDCTCCIIKPHAVSEGLMGKILNSISEAGFQISALQMFSLGSANAEEFYEVYKGIVPEYSNMVNELSSGPCMVLEIHGTDVPKTFREFCGPSDPDIARHLRPATLHALYGSDRVKNAVHCTDLPEDGVLEVQYFFKIMDG